MAARASSRARSRLTIGRLSSHSCATPSSSALLCILTSCVFVCRQGHGLSYTSFNLSIASTSPALELLQDRASPRTLSPIETMNISVTVANTGAHDGRTTVAVYFSKPLSKFVRYHKMLGAFAKTPVIKAGASATVALTLPMSKLSAYDLKTKAQKVEAGVYLLTVGQDSEEEAGSMSITVAE